MKQVEYYNKILGVTYDELTGGDDPVVRKNTLKDLLYRKPRLSLRQGRGMDNYALIDYYALPARYRARFEVKYGDPQELLKKQTMQDRLMMDGEARKFYEGYRYRKGRTETALPAELIDAYTLNASVLNELIRVLNARAGFRRALGGSTCRLWETLGDTLGELRDVYGHTLPDSTGRLKDKINQYKKDGYASLISGKLSNANTAKITAEGGRLLVALKRCRVPVYTDSQLLEEYNRRAGVKGWKELLGAQSVRLYLARPEVEPLWWDAVHGELKAQQRYGRKHRTEMPTVRDSLWYGDGTKLNLYYKSYTEDGKLDVLTTSVYEVLDAYSDVFLGYHISDSEDYEAQYLAHRMAIQTAGHKPWELVHDNQGGHKKLEAQGFFKKIVGRVHRYSAPYSPQSKSIEQAFGRFQQQVLHQDWRFTGQNISAKGGRPNLELIEANKENLYTLPELKAAYAAARRVWNEGAHHQTGVSRMEMYTKSENRDTPVVTEYDMIDMFWLQTDRPSTYTDSGIAITIKGRRRVYEVFVRPGVPDADFLLTNRGRRFITKYDPYDPTSVRLYTQDANGSLRYVCTAEPYMTIHRNLQEQQDGEMILIRQTNASKMEGRISRQVAGRLIEEEHGVSLEQKGLRRPKLKGAGKERMEREIQKRLWRNRQHPEEVSLGRVVKIESEITHDEVDGNIVLNERRVVGKL